VRGHRPAQVPRLAQSGQDQDPAGRQLPVQLGGGGEPVNGGQVDVQHGHVRAVLQRGGHDAVT
jgi:hypothetical protein